MNLPLLVSAAVGLCFAYLLAVFAVFALTLAASALEHAFMIRQARAEDYEALSQSRFTIPVSVIAPAYNEAVVIEACVRSLLALDYPELEIIVVNDGSRDGTLDVLRETFDLEPCELFYRRRFESKPIRGVYRSRSHSRLLIVDKENGGKADALNAGLNLARFRYICTVDSDTVYHPQALLQAMRVPMRDPATIVGVTSSVTISRRPETVRRAESGAPRIDDKALTNFQQLDYLRAFLNNRLGWTRWNFMLCSVGAFAIWRRDVVEDLGGFSGQFTCEDIEFTFRVHERFRRQGETYRVVALPESAGRTEGPDTIRSLISQRARWQRVITETVWHYRRMFLNPRYGAVGMLGMPTYVLVEVLAPVFQALSIAVIPLAWWTGVLDGWHFLLLLATMGLGAGVLTNVAVLLDDRGTRAYPIGDLLRLMVLGAADICLYRPLLFVAQAKGLIDFLRRDKSWHKFDRNSRPRPLAS